MLSHSFKAFFLLSFGFFPLALSQIVGTWSSDPATIVTGPSFYHATTNSFSNPPLPGSSYTFTADGFWEQATYVQDNTTNTSCTEYASAFQHGTYQIIALNFTVQLTPMVPVDGRILVNNSCNSTRPTVQPFSLDESFTYQIDNTTSPYTLWLFNNNDSPDVPGMILVSNSTKNYLNPFYQTVNSTSKSASVVGQSSATSSNFTRVNVTVPSSTNTTSAAAVPAKGTQWGLLLAIVAGVLAAIL